MATKEDPIKEIRKGIELKKAIIGTERVIKGLKKGEVSKIFLSSNCPNDVKETIQHYSNIAKKPVVELEQPNDELGILCKKQFSISVIGLKGG